MLSQCCGKPLIVKSKGTYSKSYKHLLPSGDIKIKSMALPRIYFYKPGKKINKGYIVRCSACGKECQVREAGDVK